MKISELIIEANFKFEKMKSRIYPFIVSSADASKNCVDCKKLEYNDNCYCLNVEGNNNHAQMEVVFSAQAFFNLVLNYERFLAHALAMEIGEKAYLFVAPASGGKSTFAQFCKQVKGNNVRIIADDHPVIGIMNSKVYVWNSPWSKYTDLKDSNGYSLSAVYYINKSPWNGIELMNGNEYAAKILMQYPDDLDKLRIGNLLNRLFSNIPAYSFFCKNDISSAEMFFDSIRKVTN